VARIRTIKPEYFRHEKLQDLEAENPKKYCMLVFAGLWTLCDKNGVFEYRPRQMKLDILPFLKFDIADTIETLKNAGLIILYERDGMTYGQIPSFSKHQRITGREALEGGKYPEPTKEDMETTRKQQGNIADEPVAQEGKGRERKGNGVLCTAQAPRTPLPDADFISALKQNPAYKGVNIDLELSKMDAWLLTPKARGRKKTHQFIVNWLNRAERVVETETSTTEKQFTAAEIEAAERLVGLRK